MNRSTRVLLLFAILIILIGAIWWWSTTRLQAPEVVICDNNNLLPPEACDGNWLAGVNFNDVPTLAAWPTSVCPGTLLPSGVGQCTVVTYTDVNNQKFTITVEGADSQIVQDYLNNAKPYFIVKQVESGVTPPPDANLPPLFPILINSIKFTVPVEEPQQTLRDIRDGIAEQRGPEGEPVTLNDVLLAAASGELPLITATPDQVREAATELARTEFTTAGQRAGLSQPEIDRLLNTIPDSLNALMEEPGATFLDDPDDSPLDDAWYRAMLQNNTASLVITLDWASAPTKESADLWLIWFAIDPEFSPALLQSGPYTIGANAYHAYKAKCGVYSASSRIQATEGKMTDYMWRTYSSYPYYDWQDSRIADKNGVAFPSAMWHNSSPNTRTYDSRVKGGPLGGKYYIYGGWVQGYGCQ